MTPLQTAALAVIDKWVHSHPLKELAVLELRKALDAEMQQSVEPVLWITDLDDPIICKTEFETATFCEDDQRPIPLYLHPAPQQAVTSGERAKVGDSRFESWYSELQQSGKGSKQVAREAYEAGLNEADAQQAKQVPLTDDQIIATFCTTPDFRQYVSAFKAGVKLAEKHHGIGGEA